MDHVIVVEFRAKPDRIEDFAALLDRHSRASLAEEGCLVFDVTQDPDDPAAFVLYEVYRDEATHRAHRETEHFKRFAAEAPGMVEQPGGDMFVSRRVLKRRR